MGEKRAFISKESQCHEQPYGFQILMLDNTLCFDF